MLAVSNGLAIVWSKITMSHYIISKVAILDRTRIGQSAARFVFLEIAWSNSPHARQQTFSDRMRTRLLRLGQPDCKKNELASTVRFLSAS